MKAAGEPILNEPAAFQPTRWTLVLRAAAGSHEALEELGVAYRPAVLAFFRRMGLSQEDADDATQQTLVRLLGGAGLARVAPEKGRFRSYLCACARNEASHIREQASAKKRDTSRTTSLEFIQSDQQGRGLPGIAEPAEQVFDRAYGETIVSRAVIKLGKEYAKLNKTEVFEVLLPFLSAGTERGGHMSFADRLGVSEVNARVMWSRFKASFVRCVREEISQTVPAESDVDGELRYLVQAWLAEPKRQ